MNCIIWIVILQPTTIIGYSGNIPWIYGIGPLSTCIWIAILLSIVWSAYYMIRKLLLFVLKQNLDQSNDLEEKQNCLNLSKKLRNYQIFTTCFSLFTLGFTISGTISSFTSPLYKPDPNNISLNGLIPFGFLTFLLWSPLTYWAWIDIKPLLIPKNSSESTVLDAPKNKISNSRRPESPFRLFIVKVDGEVLPMDLSVNNIPDKDKNNFQEMTSISHNIEEKEMVQSDGLPKVISVILEK